MPAHQRIRRLSFFVVILISVLLSAASWVPGKKESILSKPALQDDFADINPTYEWGTYIYTTGYDELAGMVVDNNGDILVLFNSLDSIDSSLYDDPSEIHISRYTQDGILKWQTMLEVDTTRIVEEFNIEGGGGVAYSAANSIILDNSGNAFVVGASNWSHPFIAKLDPNGVVLWTKHFDIPTDASGRDFPAETITVDSDGNLYLVSHLYEFDDGIDFSQLWKARLISQLTKVSPNGEVEWVNSFAEYGWGNYDDFERVKDLVITDQSGFIYVVSDSKEPWGEPINAFSGDRDIAVAKFDNTGKLLWNTFLNLVLPTGDVRPFIDYIQIDTNNDILLAGESGQNWGNPIVSFSGRYDGFLVKIDANGNLLWNTFIGGSGSDGVTGIFIGEDNNPFVLGSSIASWGNPIESFSYDEQSRGREASFIAQYDTNGSLLWNAFLDRGVQYVSKSGDNDFYLLGNASFNPPVEPIDFGNDDNDLFLAKLNLYGTRLTYRPPSLYVPEITLYIPTPLDISTDPKVVRTNVLLAVLLMLPFAVAVDLFSRIFSENEEVLNQIAPIAWIGTLQKRLQNVASKSTSKEGFRDTLGLLGVVAFYGLVFSLLDKTWSPFTVKGVFLFISMAFAFGLVGLLDDIVQWRTIRKWGHQGEFTVRPANIFLAAVSTTVSRLLALVPGLMFGSPEALRINEDELSTSQNKTLVKISMFTYIVIGLTAWLPTIATTLIQRQNISENQKNLVGGLEALLLVIFAVALENIFVQLVGVSEGLGKKMKTWNKWLWGIALALSAFAFLHTLLNPHYDFVSALQQGNILVFVSVSATFIVITFMLNFYLRYRSKQKTR